MDKTKLDNVNPHMEALIQNLNKVFVWEFGPVVYITKIDKTKNTK